MQPQIAARFAALSSESIESLGEWDQRIGDMIHETGSAEQEAIPALEETITEQIQRVRRAELIQKRLSLLSPQDPTPLWNTFQIAEMGANASIRLARKISSAQEFDNPRRDYWLSQYLQFRNASNTALERASRLNGPLANLARLRLLQHSADFDIPVLLDPSPLIERNWLEVSQLQVTEDNQSALSFLQGQLRMLKALNSSGLVTAQERQKLVGEAQQDFEGTGSGDSWVQRAWKLECDALIDPQQFSRIAGELLASQLRAQDSNSPQLLLETNATFRILVLLAGTEEAMDFAAARMQVLEAMEQMLLKNLVASSCIRVIRGGDLFPESIQARINGGAVLKSLAIFAPDAPLVIETFGAMISDETSPLLSLWKAALLTKEGKEVWELATWFRSKLNDSVSSDTPLVDTVDPRLLTAFLHTWSMLERQGEISYEVAKAALDELALVNSDFLSVRFMRGTMAARHSDWAQVLVDMEELNAKVPNHPVIMLLLEKAKAGDNPTPKQLETREAS